MLYHQTIISAQDYASPAFRRMAAASTAANMKIIRGTQAASAAQIRFAKVIETSRLAVSAFKTTLIMSAVSIAAIVGPTVLLTGKVAELEAALRHIVAIGGAEFHGHLWELNDAIIQVARKWGLNVQNMAEGAVELVKAGYSLEETKELLEIVGITAKAAGVDFGIASNIATYALTVWGFNINQTTELMSKMSFVANEMIIDFEDFAEVIQYVGAAAFAAGVPFEEVIAFAGILSKTAQESGMGARGMRRLILDLITDSEKFITAFRKAGVEVEYFTKDGAINLEGIIRGFAEMNINAENYQKLMPQLSVREATALLSLRAHYDAYMQLRQDASKQTDYIFGVAEQQMLSLQSKMEMIKTSFMGVIMVPEFVERLGVVLDSLANSLYTVEGELGPLGIAIQEYLIYGVRYLNENMPMFIDLLTNLMRTVVALLPVFNAYSRILIGIGNIVAVLPPNFTAFLIVLFMLNKTIPITSVLTILLGKNLNWLTWSTWRAAAGMMALFGAFYLVLMSKNQIVTAIGAITAAVLGLVVALKLAAIFASITTAGVVAITGTAAFLGAWAAMSATGGMATPEIPAYTIPEYEPPTYQHGLSHVPYTGFVASLHQGERVLTKEENFDYRAGQMGGTQVFNIYDANRQSIDELIARYGR